MTNYTFKSDDKRATVTFECDNAVEYKYFKSIKDRIDSISARIYDDGENSADLQQDYFDLYEKFNNYVPGGYCAYAFCVYGGNKVGISCTKLTKITYPAGTILWHCGNIGYNELKSSYIARDQICYNSHRIYFTQEGKLYYRDFDEDDAVYAYVCDGTETFYMDNESNGTDVYLSCDTPFSVACTQVEMAK